MFCTTLVLVLASAIGSPQFCTHQDYMLALMANLLASLDFIEELDRVTSSLPPVKANTRFAISS